MLDNRIARLLAMVCVALGTCAVAHAQFAVDGFNPGTNGLGVLALAEQPDGKILVAGSFTMLGGGGTGTTSRNRIGRLNGDGSLDAAFDPGANGNVNVALLQPDGKILVCGEFTMLGGGGTGTTTRSALGRLNADGSLDTVFNPGVAGGRCNAIVLQPDGKILVGGFFTGRGGGTGTTPRRYIGRLNADGSLDAGFNPGANQSVFALTAQTDRKILVGGFFTGLGGGTGATPRSMIGRLLPDGTVDAAFDPGANGSIRELALQADGKILAGGVFTTLGGGGTGTTVRNNIGRLNPDGSLDAAFNPGTTRDVFAIERQADGKILVGGYFTGLGGGTGTMPRSNLGRLYPDGSVDADLNPGANDRVFAMAVQPDGRILVAGDFTLLGGGGTGATPRSRIGRLNVDGSVDLTFDPGANGSVLAVAVQPDGKILVGGQFGTLGGGGSGTTARRFFGRLNADGSLDTTFTPGVMSFVDAIVLQPDGKIVIGAAVTDGATTRNRVSRLNTDGSLDISFDQGANAPAQGIYTLALQPDGKILVGGYFTMLGGPAGLTGRNYIGRLNADGSLDASFDPGANLSVSALAVQPDGKILVGGSFTTLGGGGTGTTARSFIGRLHADGSVDTSFNPGSNGGVNTFALQADGKILVGGSFTRLGGGGTGTTPRNRIGRLNPDGSLDMGLDPGADDSVRSLTLQADGKILVAGDRFTTLGGGGTGTTARARIGRLTNTDAAFQQLNVTDGGSIVTWSRGGAEPEVWRVTFESSTTGTAYASLGVGRRVAGGWQLTGQGLPTNQHLFIRSRGYYATGESNASGSIVESIRNVHVSPCALTLGATVFVAGAAGLVYPPTTIAVTGGAGTMTFSVLSGALPGGLTLSSSGVVSGTPMAAGTFTVMVVAVDANGCSGSRGYDITVTPTTLTLTPSTVNFAAVNASGVLTVATPAQTVVMAQDAPVSISWTAVVNQSWITVSPAAGVGSATLTVSINNTGGVLPASGSLTGTITVTSSGTAATASVQLTVRTPAQTGTAPFGSFDTPAPGATVDGSIAVTGWALDDIGIDRVEIWRDVVQGEMTPPVNAPGHPGHGKIFIATPLFVAGSRPDVEAAYPTTPLANRAGWGYLLLTWGLSNQGNGTYTLYAFAFDKEGGTTTLGTKTITSDNARATKPFGGIDVPAYGEGKSGQFFNFGWALTPNANSADLRTCTIMNGSVFVAIDSGPLVTVDYGDNRTDIAGSFPGLSNGSNGGGHFLLDSTTLANGTHSIGWYVVDSCGRADGIGSRFFTVLNTVR